MPSVPSGPAKPMNSSASEASKIGAAWRIQWFSVCLVQRSAGRRALGQAGGHLDRLGPRRCSSSSAMRDQVHALGLLAAEVLRRQQVVLGLGHAAQQRPDDGGMVAGGDADLQVAVGELGRLRRDGHVGQDQQRQPGAHGPAARRADDGLAAVEHAVTSLRDSVIACMRSA